MAGISKEERSELLRAIKDADENFQKGMYALAEPFYRKGVEFLGDGSPEISTCLQNLALICVERKDYNEALKFDIHLLLLNEERFGEDHAKTIALMDEIAGLYETLGRSDESRDMYERARKSSERSLWADQVNEPEPTDGVPEPAEIAAALDLDYQYSETAKLALESGLPNPGDVAYEFGAGASSKGRMDPEETMKLPRLPDEPPPPKAKDPQLETLILNRSDIQAALANKAGNGQGGTDKIDSSADNAPLAVPNSVDMVIAKDEQKDQTVEETKLVDAMKLMDGKKSGKWNTFPGDAKKLGAPQKTTLNSPFKKEAIDETKPNLGSADTDPTLEQVSLQPTEQEDLQPSEQAELQPTRRLKIHLTGQAGSQSTKLAALQPTGPVELQPTKQTEFQPTGQVELQPAKQAELQPTGQVELQPAKQAELQPNGQVVPASTAGASSLPAKNKPVTEVKLFQSAHQRNIILSIVAGCFLLLVLASIFTSHSNSAEDYKKIPHRYRTADGEKLLFLTSASECELVAGSETAKMPYYQHHGDLLDNCRVMFGLLIHHQYWLTKNKNGFVDQQGSLLYTEASPELQAAEFVDELGRSAQLSYLSLHHYPKKLEELDSGKRAFHNPYTGQAAKPIIQTIVLGKKTQTDDGQQRKKLYDIAVSGARFPHEPKRHPGDVVCYSVVIHTKKSDINTFYIRSYDRDGKPLGGSRPDTVFAVVLENGLEKTAPRPPLEYSGKPLLRPRRVWLMNEANASLDFILKYGAAFIFAFIAFIAWILSATRRTQAATYVLKAIMIVSAVLTVAYLLSNILP
jgi:tetratricopeptide (TPR) repeat protein